MPLKSVARVPLHFTKARLWPLVFHEPWRLSRMKTLLRAERGRLLRDRSVGQYGIKPVGDQGFQSMGEMLSLTLGHAVQ